MASLRTACGHGSKTTTCQPSRPISSSFAATGTAQSCGMCLGTSDIRRWRSLWPTFTTLTCTSSCLTSPSDRWVLLPSHVSVPWMLLQYRPPREPPVCDRLSCAGLDCALLLFAVLHCTLASSLHTTRATCRSDSLLSRVSSTLSPTHITCSYKRMHTLLPRTLLFRLLCRRLRIYSSG